MRIFVLTGVFALVASTALAQTDAAPEPATPEEEAPASATPENTAPADPTASQQAEAGQPANLCRELLAFVQENPPEPDATADAPAAAAATGESAGTGEDSSPASGEAVPPEPASEGGSAQEATGQSGPAHEAPEPSSEDSAEGDAENAPQTSSLSAPVPTEAVEAGENMPLSLDRAEQLAEANDIAACRDAARKLRLAGAPMPPPLLALTALDLQYQTQANDAESPSQQTQPQQ
ncbi:hypothetical protein [Chelativorans sp. YIM 93263]|uniref:hypothetical protein n=1 Tax=Chelativorans sp. YIM 93263 TaxID=2906648 RepID=UPI002378E061|nr:hypothetical protein [Chelativorans sp. YIM 93263]